MKILFLLLISLNLFSYELTKGITVTESVVSGENRMWLIRYEYNDNIVMRPFVHNSLSTIPCSFEGKYGTPLIAFNSGFFFGDKSLSKIKMEDRIIKVDDSREFVQKRRALIWYPFAVVSGYDFDNLIWGNQGMSVTDSSELGSITPGETSRTFVYVESPKVIYIVIVDNIASFKWVIKKCKELFKNFNSNNLINFDGGGSSTLKIYPKTGCKAVNYLRDGNERAIKSYIVIFRR